MKRPLLFLIFVLLSLAVFSVPVRQLMVLSQRNDFYSYIPLIPLVSGFFLYWGRKHIFSHTEYNFLAGFVVTLIGGAIGLTEMVGTGRLPVLIVAGWLTWVGLFILFFGSRAFKAAVFPLFFLLFMVPLPYWLVQKPVMHILQNASSEVVGVLFSLIGVPAVRDGHVFHLPGLSIEVAEGCSGIRSGISLLITSVIAVKLFLRTAWVRSLAVITMLPVAVLLNGTRIVTLSALGLYVDARLLRGDLHMDGSKPWFGLSLLVLWVVIVLLRKIESTQTVDYANEPMLASQEPKDHSCQ